MTYYMLNKQKNKIFHQNTNNVIAEYNNGKVILNNNMFSFKKISNIFKFNFNSQLITASKIGNIEQVKKLIEENNADINTTDSLFNTPLHLAISENHTRLTHYLIDKKADVNILNEFDDSPLHIAIKSKKINCSIIKKLFNTKGKPPSVNVKNSDDLSPLMLAIHSSHVQLIQYLLHKKANIDLKHTEHQITPLSVAVNQKNIEIVKILLDKKANINTKNSDGTSPLANARELGNVEIAQLLIDNKADIHIKDNYDQTPLHYACNDYNSEHYDIVQILLDNKASINSLDHLGNTPLHLAIMNEYPQTTTLLLDKGADFNILNYDKNSPLHLLVVDHEDEQQAKFNLIAKRLIDKGADFSIKNKNGDSPLHLVIYEKNFEIGIHILQIVENNGQLNSEFIHKLRIDRDQNIDKIYNAFISHKMKIKNNLILQHTSK